MKIAKVNHHGKTRFRVNDPHGQDGKRQRKFFDTREAAETYVKERTADTRAFGVHFATIPPEERAALAYQLQRLKDLGWTLPAAVDFVERHGKAFSAPSLTLGAVADEFLAAKNTAGLRPRYVKIVNYERPKPSVVIPQLAERILAEEGSGVLNFMLEGLDALRAANWNLFLGERQQRRVDDLLLESDSHRVFVAECLVKDSGARGMTKGEVYAAYVEMCDRRGWVAMNKNRFGKLGAEAIAQAFGLAVRGDIDSGNGKQNDGWKSLRLRPETNGNQAPASPSFDP